MLSPLLLLALNTLARPGGPGIKDGIYVVTQSEPTEYTVCVDLERSVGCEVERSLGHAGADYLSVMSGVCVLSHFEIAKSEPRPTNAGQAFTKAPVMINNSKLANCSDFLRSGEPLRVASSTS